VRRIRYERDGKQNDGVRKDIQLPNVNLRSTCTCILLHQAVCDRYVPIETWCVVKKRMLEIVLYER
jgi:hypothetical protein